MELYSPQQPKAVSDRGRLCKSAEQHNRARMSLHKRAPSASPLNMNRYKLKRYTKTHSAKGKSVFANLGVVGSGSFCTVFKVRRTSDFRTFALKRSSTRLHTEEAVYTALNEVRVMRALQRDQTEPHAHIAQFHTHWLAPFHSAQRRGHSLQLHQLYDFYAHGTLLEISQRAEPMNLRQIVQCLAQLLDGVAFVHAQRVLHLDLKPSNIFIADAFCLKLGDFGISIDLETAEQSGETHINFSGDPIYIAPECLGFARSLDNVGFAADIFALGLIALEMLFAVRVPSTGPLFEALRNFVDFETFEALPQFRALLGDDHRMDNGDSKAEKELRALIAQMLNRESEHRPTATQSLERVRRLLNDDEFVRSLSALDAIELDRILPERNAMTPTTPSTERTPTHSVLCASKAKLRMSPGNAAPTEFVEDSPKSFEEIAVKMEVARRMSQKREAVRVTPTKAKSPMNTTTPTMRRLLFLSPEPATLPITPTKSGTRETAKAALSPFDTLRKVRKRETNIGQFETERRSRKKPRRTQRNSELRKESPRRTPSSTKSASVFGGLLCFESDSPSHTPTTAESETVSRSISGESHGMFALWDDDDAKKDEENLSRSPAHQLRLSFRSPSTHCRDHRKNAAANSPSGSETECVRKHLFFAEPDEDEKDTESEQAQGSEAGSEVEFLLG